MSISSDSFQKIHAHVKIHDPIKNVQSQKFEINMDQKIERTRSQVRAMQLNDKIETLWKKSSIEERPKQVRKLTTNMATQCADPSPEVKESESKQEISYQQELLVEENYNFSQLKHSIYNKMSPQEIQKHQSDKNNAKKFQINQMPQPDFGIKFTKKTELPASDANLIHTQAYKGKPQKQILFQQIREEKPQSRGTEFNYGNVDLNLKPTSHFIKPASKSNKHLLEASKTKSGSKKTFMEITGIQSTHKKKTTPGTSMFRGSPEIERTDTKKDSVMDHKELKTNTERAKSRQNFIQRISENSELPQVNTSKSYSIDLWLKKHQLQPYHQAMKMSTLDPLMLGLSDLVKTEEEKQKELMKYHREYQDFLNSEKGKKITIYEKKLLQKNFSLGNKDFLQKLYSKKENEKKLKDSRLLEFTTTTEEVPVFNRATTKIFPDGTKEQFADQAVSTKQILSAFRSSRLRVQEDKEGKPLLRPAIYFNQQKFESYSEKERWLRNKWVLQELIILFQKQESYQDVCEKFLKLVFTQEEHKKLKQKHYDIFYFSIQHDLLDCTKDLAQAIKQVLKDLRKMDLLSLDQDQIQNYRVENKKQLNYNDDIQEFKQKQDTYYPSLDPQIPIEYNLQYLVSFLKIPGSNKLIKQNSQADLNFLTKNQKLIETQNRLLEQKSPEDKSSLILRYLVNNQLLKETNQDITSPLKSLEMYDRKQQSPFQQQKPLSPKSQKRAHSLQMASVVPGNSRELPLRNQKNQTINSIGPFQQSQQLPLLSEIMKTKAEKKLQKVVQRVGQDQIKNQKLILEQVIFAKEKRRQHKGYQSQKNLNLKTSLLAEKLK